MRIEDEQAAIIGGQNGVPISGRALNPAERFLFRRSPWRTASQSVERTANAQPAPVQHVRVLHRGTDVRVTEQLLHRSDVVAIDQQVRRK